MRTTAKQAPRATEAISTKAHGHKEDRGRVVGQQVREFPILGFPAPFGTTHGATESDSLSRCL
jgi:hypothetical protein